MPYPLPLTRTEAYLAYKAGVIQQSDLKPSLAIPRNGIDAWLAYWTGLAADYPKREDGTPHILQEEEAYIAYLCGVINEYPEKCLRRVGAYLRYLISARWGRPDRPLNREELYLSLLKTQVIPSGDPSSDITIEGTAKAPFVDVKMYGDTFQQTYTGKNLYYDTDGYTQGFLGNDGKIALSAESVTNVTYIEASENTQYVMSFNDLYGGITFRGVACYDPNKDFIRRIPVAEITDGSFQTAAGTAYIRVYFFNANGLNAANFPTNYINNIQIESGATATSYEPYVGGQPSPSPDYPLPIQTVTGRQVVSVKGKNLFVPPNSATSRGVTFTKNEDGSFNISGKAVGGEALCSIFTDINLKDGESLTLSSNVGLSTGVVYRVEAYNGNTWLVSLISQVSIMPTAITIPKNATRLRYSIGLLEGREVNLTNVTFQLEKGTATTYEPYSSNDYEINLGKNLFDVTVTPWSKGIAYNSDGELVYWNGYVGIVGYQPVEPETTYTFSNSLGKGFYYGLVFYDKDKTKISNITADTKTFTTPKNCKFIRFAIGNDVTEKPTWAQIELGSNATAYAPYFDPIGLCRIAYSANVFQDYIYKDGDDWKIHKATITKRFSGADSEGWVINNSGTENFYYRCPHAATGSYGTPDNSRYLYCNYESGAQITSSNTAQGVFVLLGGDVRLRYGTEISLDDWKAKLANNNMVLTYALATATDTVITDTAIIAQLEALLNGGAEDGTTYIKVNATDPNLPGLLYVEAPKYD